MLLVDGRLHVRESSYPRLKPWTFPADKSWMVRALAERRIDKKAQQGSGSIKHLLPNCHTRSLCIWCCVDSFHLNQPASLYLFKVFGLNTEHEILFPSTSVLHQIHHFNRQKLICFLCLKTLNCEFQILSGFW